MSSGGAGREKGAGPERRLTRIVKPNRRYSPWQRAQRPAYPNKRGPWEILAEFDGASIPSQTVIPPNILSYWKDHREALGYCSFYGMSPRDAMTIYALAKGGVAVLSVNRWGQIHTWKLRAPVAQS